jgi:hypothetical protein
MKKLTIIIVSIAVVALGLVAYFGYFKTERKTDLATQSGTTGPVTTAVTFKGRETLSYVPADTLFFYGGITTIPFTEITATMAPQLRLMKNPDLSKGISDEARAKYPPAAIMIMGMVSKNIEYLQQADAAARFGIGADVDMVGYSVGFIPVVRIKLADTAAFNKYIDDVEQYAKLKAEQKTVGNVNFRAYSFDKAGDKTPSGIELLIGVNNGYAIITLFSKVESSDVQNIIAGTTKPAKSLATSTLLPDIQAKHHFLPSHLGFINHREIINGITSADGNEFARMLDTLVDMAHKAKLAGDTNNAAPPAPAQAPSTESAATATPAADDVLDTLRTPACRTELTDLINRWPQTVFGYTKMDLNSKPYVIEARMLVENTDAGFMQDMQKIRGFIPAVLRDEKQQPVFGIGLGLNVGAVSPFVASTIQGFIAKEYQCKYLMQAKQKLMASNPAMALGMMSGMVGGVQGISASIINIDGSLMPSQPGMPPDIKNLDALVTISSANPQRLLMLAANFLPGKQPLQLPADGSAIDFPIPFPLPNGAAVKLALKGNNIVAYTGEEAAKLADALSKEPIQANGLMTFNMNFGKYMKMLSGVAQAHAATPTTGAQMPRPAMSEQDKQALAAMANSNMQFVESFDIDKNGLALDIKMSE